MDQVSAFGQALLYIIGAVIFVLVGFAANWLVAPHRPNPSKNTPYECGEEPVGTAWVQFNLRFYAMGLIFLIFDVEILLLFPWVTVFAAPELLLQTPGWGWLALADAAIFLIILALGLVYIWVEGDIDWVRPQPEPEIVETAIPAHVYETFNRNQTPVVTKPLPVTGSAS
jgi:NADH-quinone oxidoreductase subunit A